MVNYKLACKSTKNYPHTQIKKVKKAKTCCKTCVFEGLWIIELLSYGIIDYRVIEL